MPLPNLQSLLPQGPLFTGALGRILNNPASSTASTDPSKVAASTGVKNPATSAQSNSITNGAKSGNLVNQLYNLPGGGQTTSQGGYAGSPATNPDYKPTTLTSPTPSPISSGDDAFQRGTVDSSGKSIPNTPTNPASYNNALLNDPELASINSNIKSIAQQEAKVQGNQNAFVTDEIGNAITSPTTGEFFGNQTGSNSFNAMKTAQEEGNLGLEMTAEQAGFANREGQIKDAYAPIQVAPGSTAVNPYNAEPIAGGLGGYEGYQNAQNVNSQMFSYPDAVNSQGQKFSYDQSQTPAQNLQNFETNYLPNSPTYQKSTYGEAGANSVYGAGKIAGNQAAITTNTQTAGELSGVRDSVSNMSNSLISQLSTSGNFNPSNITAVNSAIQTIAANTSNPQYQILNNQMTDIAATYANILNPGASTDYTKSLSQGLINQLAKGSTIQQVIQGLDAQAQKKISGYQTAAGDIERGTNPNPNSSQVGPTVTAPDGQQIIITD